MPKKIDPLSPLGILCENAFYNVAFNTKLGYGWILETDNAYRNRMNLYKYRRDNPNPDYANIQIKIGPNDPEHELWLLKTDEADQYDSGIAV